MTAKEKAKELSIIFCQTTDIFRPNILSINNAIKCCEQIMLVGALTDEAWLNVPEDYKIQYWKEVIQELKLLKI